MGTRPAGARIALLLAVGVLCAAAPARAASPGCPSPSFGYAAQIASTPGLVAYWRLGETSGTSACDSGPGASTGTYTGGFTLGRSGAIAGDPNPAVGLDGVSGWVSVPHGSSLNVGDVFTIEAWVKRGATGGTRSHAVASKQSQGWDMKINSANQLVIRKSSVGNIATSTTTIADTTSWHHVVATKNGPAVKLYIDGVDRTGAVANLTTSNNSMPLAIGQSSSGSYFNGTIDEVALYRQPLTAAQVKGHHDAGRSGAPPPFFFFFFSNAR